MRDTKYIIGICTIIVGFLISIYSISFVIIGFPVFVLGSVFFVLSDKKPKIKLIALIVPLLMWFPCSLFVLYCYNTYLNKNTPQSILIPYNYEGKFRVVYQEKCGVTPKYDHGKRILRIPANGVLILSPKYESGIYNDEFYLVDDKGERIKINSLVYFTDRFKKRPGVLAVNSGIIYGSKTKHDLDSPFYYTDYQVYNKDTTDRVDYKSDKKLDSLSRVLVTQCRKTVDR